MEEEVDYESLKLTDLNTSWLDINPKNCQFELDALQNEMLNFYLRNDQRFRIAFYTNWTPHFIQYLKDKARLREPIHLSVIGQTRSGKSYSSISVCVIHSLLNGRVFDERYICANSYEFVEKLKEMPEEDLLNSMFLIDEEKKTVQGFGSTGRKLKILDVNNIIAFQNISTISLTPDRWSSDSATYGLRAFGRDFKNKMVRFMIYNLGENSRSGLPLGMIYLPIFTSLLPEKHAKILEDKYMSRKKEWINLEMRSDSDVIGTIHRKSAESFMRDDQFLGLKKKNERKSYIMQRLGSEWSVGEIETVLQLTNMMRNGIKFDK